MDGNRSNRLTSPSPAAEPIVLASVSLGMGTSANSSEVNDAPHAQPPLAPEDVSSGQYASVLREVYEVPSYMWCGNDLFGDPRELIRLTVIPDKEAVPHRVTAVCVPFVLVRTSFGQEKSLDVRHFQLARLGDQIAKAAWKTCETSVTERSEIRSNLGCPLRARLHSE